MVAVVHGWAIGAGFALAAAADVRFIGAGAWFSAWFIALGMAVGDLGLSWLLPRIVGLGRASELLFAAGDLDAPGAVGLGLASRVCADPWDDATTYAQRLAALPPYGVQASKRLLNASAATGLRDHLDAEGRAQVIGSLTGAAQHALASAVARTATEES